MIALAVLLASCAKKENLTVITVDPSYVYYRIQEVDKDGTVTYSEIETVSKKSSTGFVGNLPSASEDEGGHDHDGDDDHDHCPLPVKFTSFTVTKINDQNVRLYWEVATEESVDSYNIEKSIDGKTWNVIRIIACDMTGSYNANDKL